MFTFKEFLAEMDADEEDVEDLGPDELKLRAKGMLRQAQMKDAGQDDRASAVNIKMLRQQARDAKDPRKRADLQRRISELMNKEKESTDAAV